MRTLLDWLEARTGAVRAARRVLLDPLPAGARWRRAWIAALAFTFLMQVVTGFFLLTHYSASLVTAWESVFHLQYAVPGGWLLRGLHVVSAQAFVVMILLNVLLAVVQRTYTAPRELNWWLLLALLPLAIALSTTGWLLPLDQKGFWAARVPLNIMGATPVLGPALQTVMLAGSEFSHLTLTRFVALHTTLLPVLTGTVLGLYLWLSCRHAGAEATPGAGSHVGQTYWPDQVLKNAVACLAVLVTVLIVVMSPRWFGTGEAGAELLAPADPGESYAAARPEWFMLWLFQFLKLFPGGTEVIGAVVVPGLLLAVLAVMPWTGRARGGRIFNVSFLAIVALGAGLLAGQARRQDARDPAFQAARRRARVEAARAVTLASGPNRIPPTGALELLRTDPGIQGPRLFARHCASCHGFDGQNGLGVVLPEPPSASDLQGFASREWLAGMLDPVQVAGLHYFGGTRFKDGKMAKFVQRDVAGFDTEHKEQLRRVIAAVSAEAALPAQQRVDTTDAAVIEEGRRLARTEAMRCTECHAFRKPDEDATAPDLTGYGSREWLRAFIADPSHGRFYGRRNDRMPRFGADAVLDPVELDLVVDWLRGGAPAEPESEE